MAMMAHQSLTGMTSHSPLMTSTSSQEKNWLISGVWTMATYNSSSGKCVNLKYEKANVPAGTRIT